MQTEFTALQLQDTQTASSAGVIRKCVHCGFCTATCPTYVLLGDELDSPRGRIYLMKDMLENQRTPTAEVVKHIDRCLSCLSCMTTCPSGVNYMHLVDHGRAYIETHYRRPLAERALRGLLAALLPYPRRFRAALVLAQFARPAAKLLAGSPLLRPLAAMLALAPRRLPPVPPRLASAPVPAGTRRGRVALMQGCAEPVLRPDIRAATLRLLDRLGYEVVLAEGEACCGALVHHMGRAEAALAAARRNVDAWTRQIAAGLDAIVITTSGCGTTVKDYGFMLRDDPAYAEKATRISALARDIAELVDDAGLPAPRADLPPGLSVAYHSACSMQHGQKITLAPQRLLQQAGFRVSTPAEAHLCCGSAGTYNLLQPEIAGQLGDRKAQHLLDLQPDIIATGNIGCMMQIGARTQAPVLHTVELLDWATGGPVPAALTPQESAA